MTPPPGNLPSVGYNLTALSQDARRAKSRHPTETGACGDILVRAKPPVGLERCQEPRTLRRAEKAHMRGGDCARTRTHPHRHTEHANKTKE